jgi:rod shape-determining protein MreD
MILVAVVIQTTLFGRLDWVTPDLVMLVAILLTLTRIRPEAVLALAFVSGLIVDLLGSSLVGLRAMVFAVVAYVGYRTRDRAEIGRPATIVWAGILSFVGIVLIVLIGTLFGEPIFIGSNSARVLFLVPVGNMVIAAVIAPSFVRLVDGDRGSFRYA